MGLEILMNRNEKVQFCQESNEEFGAYNIDDFDLLSDEELEECVDFLDYLWEK